MSSRPPRRGLRRRIAVSAAALGALLLVAAALAPWIVSGSRFGRVASWVMPATRGTVSIGGGHWSWGAVWALWRGHPAPLRLNDIRVVDPEGTEVLRVEEITGMVELSRDRSRLAVRDLHVRHAAWRFAQMRAGRDVGFLAAFLPRARAPARPRARRAGLASFVIEGAQLDGVDAVFDFPSWGLALADVHGRGQLALAAPAEAAAANASSEGAPAGPASATAPAPARPVFTFDVSDADLRGGGLLRLLSGRARTELPFSGGRIDRVATTAARPNALELSAREVATGRSRLTLEATFTGATGSGRARSPGGMDLRARLTDAADALSAALARRFAGAGPGTQPPVTVAGAGAELGITVTDASHKLLIEATARGFDVGARGLALVGAGGALSVEPLAGRARVTGLGFSSPAGGRLTLDADLDHLFVRGTLALDHFATTPYLPGFLRPLAGGILDGRLRGGVDLVARSASLDDAALTFMQPAARGAAGAKGRRLSLVSRPGARASGGVGSARALRIAGARFVAGTLILPEIGAALAGGQITARARVTLLDAAGRLRPPIFDVDARARRVSFGDLAGATFARGELSFRARVRGTLDDLTVTLDVPDSERLRVFGEICRLPASTTFRFDGQDLTLPPPPADLRLRGASGAELSVAGRIGRDGDLGVVLDVRGFPIAKLPALAEADLAFTGTLSGRMHATGEVRAPRLAGQITVDDAGFQGQPLGGGTLVISPAAGGGIHGAGQVIRGVTLDGTLQPAGGDVRGVATLRMDGVRLDPLLTLLPGGARARGVISGTLEARVAPRVPAEVQARLSQLELTVTGGGDRGAAGTFELHAVDEVRVSARARGGPLRIDAARFAGTPGTLDITGDVTGGRLRGTARGRLALGAIAPLLLPRTAGSVSRLAGDIDFDVATDTARPGAAPIVTGTLRVATPVSFRAAALPVDVRLDTGSARLDADGVVHVDLPMTLGAGTIRVAGVASGLAGGAPQVALDASGELDARLLPLAAPRAIAWATGSARVDAHAEGDPRRALTTGVGLRVRARVRPTALALALRAAPGWPMRVLSGEITVDDGTIALRALRVDAGGKVDVSIGAPADGPAVVALGSLLRPRPGPVALPVRGRVTAMQVAPLVIDDATFALRLDGDLARRARLAGDITLGKAHVPPGAGKRAAKPAAARKSSPVSTSPLPSALRRPELARVDLDVHAHSSGGALTVEVNNLPDVHVDLDYHVRGTPLAPQIAGQIRGDGIWSSFALLLQRLFQ